MLAHLVELLTFSHRSGLVVAAHPDDETIGAAALMTRLERCHVFHITDGAPHDRSLWTSPGARTRGDYARIRRAEVARALALAGLEPRCASSLGVGDLEATRALTTIAQRVAALITMVRPDFVVTHAYEGGHPDHDAASFGAWAATHLVARQGLPPPPIIEMALYHGAPGYLVMGQFLPSPAAPELELRLTDDERWRKHAMLDCFGSQALTLMPFRALEVERYRVAPEYDYTRPPHDGPLLYEQRHLGMTGAEWREQAVQAMRLMSLVGARSAAAQTWPARRDRMDSNPDLGTGPGPERGPGKGGSDEALT
ncbi:MAG TPA: PIG-L family deacetylase [Haliangium sp.]|nr:PIG-L family deacetylase [Haliangium sp.]